MKRAGRWVYALTGVLVLFVSGIVYAWSVLAEPVAADFPAWSKAALSLTFTLVMIFFCAGCTVGGLLAGKLKARLCILISAAMMLGGFLLAAKAERIGTLYAGFGILCGFASGFAYNAVMSTVGKWFPDRQGMISGILLMGFGISSFVFGKLFRAFTPETTGAWRGSYTVIGIAAAAALALGGLVVRRPDEEEIRAFSAGKGTRRQGGEDVPTKEMIRRPAFWYYFLWAVLLSAGGLMLTSQAAGMARDIYPSITSGTVATAAGLISVANAVSRVIMGTAYDRVGRSGVMLTVCGGFIVTGIILLLALRTHSFPLLILGFLAGGVSYGGITPTNSAFTSACFGMRFYPLNFSVINLNLLLASFGSTVAGALYDRAGNYQPVYFVMTGLAVAGIVLSLLISKEEIRRKG